MKLESVVLVNWGSLRSGEYPMGNMTLLTGPTGSGKSTMLDALQTVMTAVHQHIFSFNPGQDETSQSTRNGKTKRSIWSYIAGAEDNLFARPNGAHGYVGLVFKPSEGESGTGFSALVGAAARIDGVGGRRQAVQERLALLIIDDAELRLHDLVDRDLEENMRVVEVEKVESHLKAHYPKVNNHRDNKREYLCQLYGRFRGVKTVSFAEAEAAAKSWCQAIAHKPIGSVDELVKTQILEHDAQKLAQSISEVSDIIRQVTNLRREGERITANITRLDDINAVIDKAKSAHEKATSYQVLMAKRYLKEDEKVLAAANEKLNEIATEIGEHKKDLKTATDAHASVQEGLVNIEAKLKGISAAADKKRLDDKKARAEQTLRTAIRDLIDGLGNLEILKSTAAHLTGVQLPPEFGNLQRASRAVAAESSRINIFPVAAWQQRLNQALWNADIVDGQSLRAIVREIEVIGSEFVSLFESISGATDSFASAVSEQLGALSGLRGQAAERERTAGERKRNLASGAADYPRDIQHALRSMRNDIPHVEVHVLCDLVEPRDESWMPAIEGYLDRSRFNLIVAEEDEREATQYLKDRFPKARVVQGRLCVSRARPDMVPTDSIIHELITDHPVARAYLIEQYGQVVKVDDFETLRMSSRGLMKNGQASGSRTFFRAEVDSNVFGRAQREIARKKAESDHMAAIAELSRIDDQNKGLRALLAMVQQCKRPSFMATTAASESVNELELVREELKLIDLTEVETLLAEKQGLSERLASLNKVIGEHNRSIGQKEAAMTTQQQLAKERAYALPGRERRVSEELHRLKTMCEANIELSMIEMIDLIDDMLANDQGPQNLQEAIQRLQLSITNHASDLREVVADYNQSARKEERLEFPYSDTREAGFAPVYAALVDLHGKSREQLKLQKENGLYKNIEQLRQAESSFQDVFTKQFCYEIRNSVDTGVRTLRALNHELDKLKFGSDKFRIDWSAWVPEFEEYYRFFSAAYDLAETQESKGLFDEEALSQEDCEVRDRLVSMLLSSDQEKAQKELQRIADYRNYRRYEIWKESDTGSKIALSEWGTGSGGQLETPAYIIRAAVVTNRLKHFDKGTNLKLLVNDESFAKMDERRAHDVMKFIRDHLGMQLVCAMPTKHAGALKSEFTREWCFTRTEAEGNGEVDFISEADERILHTDRLRELWESRREEVRQQAQMQFEAAEEGASA